MNVRADTEVPGRWRVRFLNGALRSRTIGLKPGPNLIGSAQDCDIVLHGDVMPHHLVLSAGEIAVTIQRVGAAVARINGEELSLRRRSGAPGDVISAGDVDFELARMAEDGKLDRTRSAAHSVRDPAAPPAKLQAQDAGAPSAGEARAGRALSKPAFLLILAGAVIGTAGGFGWHAFAGTTAQSASANAATTPDWRDVLPALEAYPQVLAAPEPNGKVTVKGYVDSRQGKAALVAQMQRFGDRVTVNVQVTEELLDEARRYIDEPGIEVRHAGGGQLIVSGRTMNEGVREKIRRLKQDLGPALSLRDHVQYGPDKALGDGDGTIELATWQAALPSPVVGITELAANVRYVQLANGDRYYEGSQLKAGHELTRIDTEAGRLIITKNGTSTPVQTAIPGSELRRRR